jgi:hypothetical protein
MWYTYGYGRRQSSVPSHLTAPNGLNFSKSGANPHSRLNRVRDYLIKNGPKSKRDILRDVFGKVLDSSDQYYRNPDPNVVNRGWNSTFFRMAIHHGFLKKVRVGNVTMWSVN